MVCDQDIKYHFKEAIQRSKKRYGESRFLFPDTLGALRELAHEPARACAGASALSGRGLRDSHAHKGAH